MFYKLLPALFLCAFVLPMACVTVNVDDDNSTTSGNNGGGSTGASGVSTTKKATDFTPQEQDDFCGWLVNKVAPQVGDTVDCGGGNEITIEPYSKSQCEAELANNPGCPVSELEGCFGLLLDDPCLLFGETAPAACVGLDQCASDTGGNNVVTTNNVSTSEFCYDHDCNGDATGEQCFSTQEDYCTSLCLETNCISVESCEIECF